MYNSVPVQVDRQWLEQVRNICGEEDMDRIMAQTIALEDNQQATSRDHLYGIEDHVLREGQYANTVRGNVQCIGMYIYMYMYIHCTCTMYTVLSVHVPPEAAHSFFLGKVTALCVLCCFALLFV